MDDKAKDITVESATRDVLMSAAKLIQTSCVDAALAFSKCKHETSDPEKCLKLGAAVMECTTGVLRKTLTKCPEEFEAFRKCMDKTQFKYQLCRPQEGALDEAFYDD